jgi:hypothetical protein
MFKIQKGKGFIDSFIKPGGNFNPTGITVHELINQKKIRDEEKKAREELERKQQEVEAELKRQIEINKDMVTERKEEKRNDSLKKISELKKKLKQIKYEDNEFY